MKAIDRMRHECQVVSGGRVIAYKENSIAKALVTIKLHKSAETVSIQYSKSTQRYRCSEN